MAHLYLLPTLLAPDGEAHIPAIVRNTIRRTRVFVVERTRSARRFLRALDRDFPIDDAEFIELNKHDLSQSLMAVKLALEKGEDISLMSEAGSPCIADPGAQVVNLARDAGFTISPLTGPSSIILGLMASGMNGQNFTFHGYLPIKDMPLQAKLKEISSAALKEGSTHIFIETPYRNKKLLGQIIKVVDRELYLSVGINLSGPDEKIITKPLSRWSSDCVDKSPSIFCIGKLVS